MIFDIKMFKSKCSKLDQNLIASSFALGRDLFRDKFQTTTATTRDRHNFYFCSAYAFMRPILSNTPNEESKDESHKLPHRYGQSHGGIFAFVNTFTIFFSNKNLIE
jgi:hypothetical protein